jgi:tetratricopeptide (TPR) repeat protein
MPTHRFLVAVTALVLLLSGCVSPEEHYQRAQSFEASGQYAAAAEEYLATLSADSNFPGARAKAGETGRLAIEDYLRAATGAEASRDYRGAAKSIRSIDDLVARASRLGVSLPLAPGYAQRRRSLFDLGIQQAVAEASRLEARGQWQQALNTYEAAERDFAPDARQEDMLDDARYRTLIAWGEADLQAGEYESAIEKADRALEIYGPASPASRDAQALRASALDAARIYVAPTPVWRDDAVSGEIPRTFLRDLDDDLVDLYWSNPPELVAIVDPHTVRREVRARDYDREILSVRRAANLGASLGADRVVVMWIDRFTIRDEGRETPRTARKKDGSPVPYKLFEGRRVLRVRAAWEIVDVASRRAVQRGDAEASASVTVARAIYSGDVRALKLTSRERAWFDADANRRDDEEVEKQAAERLAEALAGEIYAALGSGTP